MKEATAYDVNSLVSELESSLRAYLENVSKATLKQLRVSYCRLVELEPATADMRLGYIKLHVPSFSP